MNEPSDNFNRRRFLKSEIDGILNQAGLRSTFAQTHYLPKKGKEDGGDGPPVIRL